MIDHPLTTSIETHAGLRLRIRPMAEGDEPILVDIFDHLGSDSRYMRFHEPLDGMSADQTQKWAEEILETTLDHGFGLLAFTDLPEQVDVPAGGARYVKVTADTAEVAISIRDDLQKQGIGASLLRLLAQQARTAGITKLIAIVQAQNRPVMRLLQDSPYPVKRYHEAGELFIEADISMTPGSEKS